jgi:type II secretory pathway pseudopilin PulG
MMVVIFVIGLLLTFGVPGVMRMQTNARARATQATVHIIDKAVRMYHGKHGDEYPEDNSTLVQCLTGYRDNDRKEGYGYRLETRGVVYGPWNGTEKIPTRTRGSNPPHFVDSFGYEIDYRTFDTGIEYFKTGKAGGPEYFRRDYWVRSPGPDGVFSDNLQGDELTTTDDITNYFGFEE